MTTLDDAAHSLAIPAGETYSEVTEAMKIATFKNDTSFTFGDVKITEMSC